MAEKERKEEKPAPPPEAPAKEKKAGGKLGGLPVMLAVVMIVEAGVIFAGIKLLGGSPKTAGAEPAAETASDAHGEAAAASGGHGEHGAGSGGGEKAKVDPKKVVEITVIKFKAPNRATGTTYIYDVEISVTTKGGENKEKVSAGITDRSATIMDRIRTIIAQTDPAKLGGGQEPGLETLRRQIKFQLEEIIGPGLIEEVVIPKCIPYRADF